MAFDIVDKSYSGTYAAEIIMLSLFGMDTVEKNLVFVKGDIAKQHTIPRMNIKNVLTPRQSDPVDSGVNGFTIDGRVLIPQDMQVYKEFNPRDFEDDQYAEELESTIINRSVPASIEDKMMQLLMNRAGESIETSIWQGSTDYRGVYTENDDKYQLQFFDGFMKMFVNDPLINLSTISPVAITTLNIQTILDDLLGQVAIKKKAMITDKLRFQRLKFTMSPVTGDIYGRSLTTGTTYKGNQLSAAEITPWRGYKVETVAGMPDNTIILCHADGSSSSNSNLWVGMNSESDWTLKLDRVNAKSENWFMLGKWKYCVQYGWAEEIFMYTTLTAANFTA